MTFHIERRLTVAILLLIASVAATAAAQVEPTRVLIINSFGPEHSPYEVFESAFRTALAQRVATPVAFYDTSLDGARFDPERDAASFVRFLQERFADRAPDLVVPVGPLAARFYAEHRKLLFANTPVTVAMAEERVMQGMEARARDAGLTLRLRIPDLVEHILRVAPATRTIAIVIGDSPIERFWVNAMGMAFEPFRARVSFQYLNELSLGDIERRVASLPSHSAILFVQMYVDGAGVSRDFDHALDRIHRVANAPIFGLYASQLGKGIVGGPLVFEAEAAVRTAEIARAVLAGEPPTQSVFQPFETGVPTYDWRELERWGISETLLPEKRTILFRPPSLWEQHRIEVLAGVSLVLLQSAILAALLIQRVRRRRAEREAHTLSGRLITAHEDERRRLASELHDDVTQRLARLAIEAAALQPRGAARPQQAEGPSMYDELVRLSEDVHALSYRLHPTVLDDLGLMDALRAECDRTSRGQAFQVDFEAEGVPDRIPQDAALCLFRIAQEALRNIVRHAKARIVSVSIARNGRGLQLAVVDDGVGFNASGPRPSPSLGHASMRERARQAGGNLEIRSAPGQGTAVFAWVPLIGAP